MRILLFFIILLACIGKAYSQNEYNNWYFGAKAAVNFKTTPPTVLKNSAMRAWAGCASISDKNGSLLFYTNGQTVWNRNHNVMDNGSGLKGDTNSTQSSLIIPLPGSTTIYYLFTTDAFAGTDGLQYSIVDMTASSGLGKVIKKNILLHAPVTEKLTAALHRNEKDVWIVAHDWRSNHFLAYVLTSAGINTKPVISSAGSVHGQNTVNDSDATGYMKFSHNYKKLAVALERQLKVELFDFEAGSGIVSGGQEILFTKFHFPPGRFWNPHGLEFSPDNSKLFVSVRKQAKFEVFDLYHCDIKDILASRQVLAEGSGNSMFVGISGLQLAPDGDIYWGQYDPYHEEINIQQRELLWRIKHANNVSKDSLYCGLACMVFMKPYEAIYGMPNIFYSKYFMPDFSVRYSCSADSTQFLSDSTQSDRVQYKWDFGEAASGAANFSTLKNPKHIYSKSGKYLVQQIRINGCIIDTIQKEIEVLPVLVPPLGKDTVLCQSSTLVLDAKNNGARYLWSTSDTISKITVNKTGKYWVQISNSQCQITDTVFVRFSQPLADSIYGARSVCPNYGTIDYTVNGDSGAVYLWKVTGGAIISGQGTDSVNIFWNGSGNGSLSVIEKTLHGCVGDSVYTKIHIDNALQTPIPQGKTHVCAYESELTYSTVRKNGSVYNWKIEGGVILSGNGTHEIIVNWLGEGKGKLSVKETGGIVPCEGDTVSLEVEIHPLPQKPVIEGERIVCQLAVEKYYTKSISGSTYIWKIIGGNIISGQGTDTITVQWKANGTQQISLREITQYGCESEAAKANVTILKSLAVNSGNDITICSGQSVEIGENNIQLNVQYKWLSSFGLNDSTSPDPIFSLNNYTDSPQVFTLILSGTYTITGCRSYDTLHITVNPQPTPFLNHKVSVCSGKEAVLDAGNTGSTYIWNNGAQTQKIVAREKGWYTVTIKNEKYLCSITDSVYVDVKPLPILNLSQEDTMYICPDNSQNTLTLDAGEHTYYTWFPNGHSGRYLHITDTGFYKVEVANTAGCISADSVHILWRCPTIVYVPNAFSPNNDSYNDVFLISGNDFIEFHLDIYNRWGERVFSTTDPNVGWDGHFKSNPAPVDVYLWKLSYKGYTANGKITEYLNGVLHLLR